MLCCTFCSHVFEVYLIENGFVVVACQGWYVMGEEGGALQVLPYEVGLVGYLVGREAW